MPTIPGGTIVMLSPDGTRRRFRRLSVRGREDPDGHPTPEAPVNARVQVHATPAWVQDGVETRVELLASTTTQLVDPSWTLFGVGIGGERRDLAHLLSTATGWTTDFTAFGPGAPAVSTRAFEAHFSARISEEFGTLSAALTLSVYAQIEERVATGFVRDLAVFVPGAAAHPGYEVVFDFSTETPPAPLPHRVGFPLREEDQPYVHIAMMQVVERAFAEQRRVTIHFELDRNMPEMGRLIGVEPG